MSRSVLHMIKPEIPKNENERLSALYSLNILDTMPENEFDSITKLASHICGTASSWITFVDSNRQWLKSRIGMNLGETPREYAFCAHAINQPGELMEIEDAAKDVRSMGNPLVDGEPYIRFYAGVPIVDSNGFALGTLCVLDDEPRELNVDQKEALKFLASQVSVMLDLRAANDQLSLSKKKYDDLINHIDDVIYELGLDGKFKFVNQKFIELSEYSEAELLNISYWDLVKPEQKVGLNKFYKHQEIKRETRSYYEFAFVTKTGKQIWVGQNLVMEFGADGALMKVFATCRDIDEKRKQEQILQLLSDNSNDLICLHTSDGIFIYISKSVTDLLAYEEVELIDQQLYDYIHPEDVQKVIDVSQGKILQGEEVCGMECRLRNKQGNYVWFESYIKPIFNDKGVVDTFQTSFREISVRKHQEKLLESNKSNLEAIIENTEAAIWSVDQQYHYKIINRVYSDLIYRVAGFRPVIGGDGLDLPKAIFKELKKHYDRAFRGEKHEIDFSLTVNGKRCYYKKYFHPIIDIRNEIVGVSVYARNVTKEKYIQSRAERYKEGLQLLNNISANNYLSTRSMIKKALELSCFYLRMNSGALLKKVKDQWKIMAMHDDFSIGLSTAEANSLQDSFIHELLVSREAIIINSLDNLDEHEGHQLEKFGVESYLGVPVYVHGEFYGTISFLSDKVKSDEFDTNDLNFIELISAWISSVLERDQYQSQLLAEKETLKEFVKSAPAAIAMMNTDLEYVAISSRWIDDYSLGDADIIGKEHYQVFPEVTEEWRLIHKRCLTGEVVSRERDPFRLSTGEIQWIKWEIRPWYELQGVIGGIIMFSEIVTDLVEQEEQLRRAKEEAEKAARAKETFLSTMSHEIRTPMNAIIGIANLLLTDNPRPDQLDHLSLLKFSSTNLLSLINDILDFNKIEAGKMDLEAIDFNFKEVASNVCQTLGIRAEEKGLALIFDYQSGIPKNFIGDPVRVTQVLTNLLSNAIKFTPFGYVKLEVTGKRSGEKFLLKVVVTDTGIGIPEDKHEVIFENFTQASSSVTREYGGTGLGLAITKKLLMLMDSDVMLASTPDEGSEFSFYLRLPVGRVKSLNKGFELKTNVDQVKSNSSIHILIAEDNLANQKVLSSFLDRWSYAYDLVNNGKEAVEKIQNRTYSLVLMDVQMPVMDGLEAVRQIRSLSHPYFSEIPIFALTASVLLGAHEKASTVGMNGYIGKPFDPDELYTIIIENALPYAACQEEVPSLSVKPEISLSDSEFEDEIIATFQTDLVPVMKELLTSINERKAEKMEALYDSILMNPVFKCVQGLDWFEQGGKNQLLEVSFLSKLRTFTGAFA